MDRTCKTARRAPPGWTLIGKHAVVVLCSHLGRKREEKNMLFKEGADVLTSGGQKVGRIERVLIDPKSKKVSHLVVKKGLLFTQDKVIALDLVGAASEDRVVLKEDTVELEGLPDFEETHHIPVENVDPFHRGPAGCARPVAWYFQRMAGWQPPVPSYSRPQEMWETKKSIPPGAITIQEKAKVFSRRGEYLGNVERVDGETAENRATQLLISKGLISKQRKMVPIQWVEWVREDSVWLSVGKNCFANLPSPC